MDPGFSLVVIYPPVPFSGVLLAGGKSARMGFDKACLIVEGQPLWRRQLATLLAVEPQELLISGRPGGPYVDAGLPVIFDAEPDRGPISGVVAALRHKPYSRVLLLAVDLPAMTPDFLRRMVDSSAATGLGVVPRWGERYEPLAAVYTAQCLPIMEESMRGGDYSLQHVVGKCVATGLATEWAVDESSRALFLNVNRPCDVT